MRANQSSMPTTQYVILIVGILLAFYWYQYMQTERTVTLKVTDKVVKVSGNSKSTTSTYLVFTDQGVYKNTDNLFLSKFNSSDVYGYLKVDSTYRCKVYGWRVPALSMYPNIISASQTPSQP